jgi:hypothetical protein
MEMVKAQIAAEATERQAAEIDEGTTRHKRRVSEEERERYEQEHRKEMVFSVTRQCLSLLQEVPLAQVQLRREARLSQR